MAAKKNACKANVGTRKEPIPCGKPIAEGMLAACEQHKTALIPHESQIYCRGGSYCTLTYHAGRQHKSFHRTLAEAREARGDRTGTLRQKPTGRKKFDGYAREWIGSYQGRTTRGFDVDTRESYRWALEHWAIPEIGSTLLRDIDREDMDKLIVAMQKEGLSAHSIAKYIAPLRALFSDAVERGHMPANPALGLRINAKVQGPQKARPEALSPVELAAVLDAIPDRWRLLFDVLAGTGCRISECLGLDWEDLEQRGDVTTLTINKQYYRGKDKDTKSEAGTRTITLDPALAAKLWAAGADSTGAMFHTRTGERLNDRNLRRVLDQACDDAGVRRVGFHVIRHTHNSILREQGWTEIQAAARLGHDPVVNTQVYSHALSEPDVTFLGKVWAMEHPETTANDAGASAR